VTPRPGVARPVFAIDATDQMKGTNVMRKIKAAEYGNHKRHELSASFWYNEPMTDDGKKSPEYDRLLTDEELAVAVQRRKEGMKLHEIESNPLDAEQIAIFEMFERERWSHEKCRDYIFAWIERRKRDRKK
jgi:hypothetical protein